MIDFATQHELYLSVVESSLDALISENRTSIVSEAMRYSLLGCGKRVRAVLLLACADMLSEMNDDSVKLASAIECIHAYSLVHDDLPCMDDDDLRRGKPSCHIAFSEPAALLAGDGLLTLGLKTAATIEANGAKAVSILADMAGYQGMIYGQELDLNETEVNVESLTAIHRYKTGCLFNAAFSLGALSVGQDPDSLADFSNDIGRVFQLVDDIIDYDTDTSANLAQLLGIDIARRYAYEITERAVRMITVRFGDRADFLAEYVRRLVGRIK